MTLIIGLYEWELAVINVQKLMFLSVFGEKIDLQIEVDFWKPVRMVDEITIIFKAE